ncbi:gamma-glutamyltransferase [Paenibacillus senegalensis]|uniref:gamma-glutamyltransferase n=1 Tax=Paenibacillus senegalensis TaxID=1465766 RepID=UPI000287DA02|nr:gamma-glutamyltransferase [Paenibacillus senegalensis]
MPYQFNRGAHLGSLVTGRPPAIGRKGAVTSPHYLATLAGYDLMKKGGHAVDAAIAINAVLCVVYPHMAGIGGDLFALVWDNPRSAIRALNGSGAACGRATRRFYGENGHSSIPSRGPLSAITVPGAVDAWHSLHAEYGKLPWKELFAPAIDYAQNGFPVTFKLSRFLHRFQDEISRHGEAARMLLPGGTPAKPGDMMRLPDLGLSLQQIAEQGAEVFYQGELARTITGKLEQAGGLMRLDDFQAHRSTWEPTISTTYRGYEIHQTQPNTQGIAALMILNYLERFDLSEVGDQSAEYYHLMAEAAKLAFTYRDRWVTDPKHLDIPIKELLSKDYVEEVLKHLDMNKAGDREKHREQLPHIGVNRDTVYMAAVDDEGNAVSLIQSIYHEFGSMYIPEGTGILLQNRGSFFALDQHHPNTLEPGKKTFHTIIPAMALKDGKPFMLYGSMGGEGQPQTQAALITRVIDFGYNIQQAIEAPRWLYGRTWGAATDSFKLEARVASSVLEMLQTKGHLAEFTVDWSEEMGHAQGIVFDRKQGALSAGADPRGDGLALSW